MTEPMLLHGDALELLRTIPDKSVALVLTDPPYNIGKADWDRIDGYIDWCLVWLRECCRVLKDNGVLYFWHNDMPQIAQLMNAIAGELPLIFDSFCIWNKGDTFRKTAWCSEKSTLRSWFNVCEFCVHYFMQPVDERTGLEQINSNPACFRELKDWYRDELRRLGLTQLDVAAAYTAATGKSPAMLRHYFQDSQFEIPTQAVWDAVYIPLGFSRTFEELRSSYEELRNPHNADENHCNVWDVPAVPSTGRVHPCEKPVPLLQRIVRVSSRPGDTVLDCFMGSGTTGLAAVAEGRGFIGIERDGKYFNIARQRIENAAAQMTLF